MNRLRKIARSVLSALLIAGVLLSSSAIAPMTVTPAHAISPISIVKKGLGGLSSIASAVGPALVGKILNATGHSDLADYFGLNTNQHLKEIMNDMEDVKEQLGDISEQVDNLSAQLGSTADRLASWTTLTTFQSDYGALSSTYTTSLATIQRLIELQEEGTVSDEELDKEIKSVMEELYDAGSLRQQVYAMGDAIMGVGSSLGSPTHAYYENMKQVDGITRDELIDHYDAFTTSVYQDYVMSVMLTNGAMAYLASERGGSVNYEIQIDELSQQAQNVLAFLVAERESLFPTTSIDGYTENGGVLPDSKLTANDYTVIYENGQIETIKPKDGVNEEGGFERELSAYHLVLNVGEAAAVKNYFDNVQYNSQWESSDPNVAVGDEFSGIFATGVGTAILTAQGVQDSAGNPLQVQVDVVDVDTNGTAISTTTADMTEAAHGATYALSELLEKAGVKDAKVSDYTWSANDPQSATVQDGIVSLNGSGGYCMVIGTRQVQTNTNYNSFTEIEKVVLPFKVAYNTEGIAYDYDDLMYYDQENTPVTLASDLNTSTAYGKIMANSKPSQGLTDLSIDGAGHSIDLVGQTLMKSMNNCTVKNLGVTSSITMNNAAIVDFLPASGTIENCDINLDIQGNQPYLGAAANESQGRIAGVNVRGSVINSYVPDQTSNIVGKAENCAFIPFEGRLSTTSAVNDIPLETAPSEYAMGTGGVVGRQDVNASLSGGTWTVNSGTENTGIYNCYSESRVEGTSNVGGIAGLAVGDWSVYNEASTTYWSGYNAAPNAAYVKIYATESRGNVRATDETGAGVAGGIVGLSVFADIKGAGVTADVTRVTGANNSKGRTAGVSGIYMPTFTRHDYISSMPSYNKGIGFLIEGVIVNAAGIQDNNNWGQNAIFFNKAPYSLGEDYAVTSKTAYLDRYLYWDDGSSDSGSSYPTYNIYGAGGGNTEYSEITFGAMNEYLQDEISAQFEPLAAPPDTESTNYVPHLTTSRVDDEQFSDAFILPETFVYGDPIAPTSSRNVKKIVYHADNNGGVGDQLPSAPTDVGNYIARVYFASGQMEDYSFSITPRTVKLVPPTTTALTYNGREQTVKSPYISNLVPGDDVELTIQEGTNKGTDVGGNYALVVTGLSGADATNYQLENDSYTMNWSIVESQVEEETTVVETITPEILPSDITSAGGNVSLNLTGQNLQDGVVVGLFDGNQLVAQGQSRMIDDDCVAWIDIPENTSEQDKTYTLKVSYDDGKSFQSITGATPITVPGVTQTEPVRPSVEAITVNDSDLTNAGGNVPLELNGDNLESDLIVGLFDENNQLIDQGTTLMVGDKCITSINVPENTTEEEKTYTLMVSYDGGKTFQHVENAEITVPGSEPAAPEEPVVNQVSADRTNLNHEGDSIIVTMLAENLDTAPTVGLFDGNETLDQSLTTANGNLYQAILDVPANETAETVSYSVRVSLDGGKTYLATPIDYLTVAGDPDAALGEGDDHAVFVNTDQHGWVNVEPHRAQSGEKVVLTVTPADGYALDELSLMDENGYLLGTVASGENEYYFTMPETAVSIAATFVKNGAASNDLPFADVHSSDWFYDPVAWAYSEGLMTGTGATTFAPNLTTTRGMIVAILHRLEGSPSVSGGTGFSDVAAGDWYAEAVNWAASEGIVNGYGDGSFGPNDAITREQMAAMLYNYAEMLGLDTSARVDLSRYSDQPSAWAQDVMSWANAVGIINGTSDSILDPQGQATRAQVAAMLERFVKYVL